MIRLAERYDLDRIVEIYNQAIEAKFQTAFTEKFKVEDREDWFYEHDAATFPLFVYVKDDKVVGWFSISPYRAGRPALKYAVEISYFVHNRYLSMGIGSQLLEHGINACKDLNYRSAIAIILDKNTPSIKLMERFNFEKWAYLPGVADFDGEVCGHVYYGVLL
jgi:L-amino acid N-acyltransferase YncA